ncbi:pyridoxal-dependent decarboxylase, exosortase A system-associated [Erythrobacteraceae bacterium CFH 75059]|uniref:pyridoxal-dependent decarboxylase, exosortase A system-associated n=1 Tax=Qipengyuania thermophila TaxID=2509361 RepID=UPI0010223EBA|nr:pyridoxal-dependent decarboxylase, exosortase A system-associated [Qipengyuania thermophila]TCD05319.1 pyridoxal-dependent decarboxylase, exosortase A system-associated [Erythrobacteraceae bacterium CFH 75059]
MADAPQAKPLGPIPPGFGTEAGALTIGGWHVNALIDRAGRTPLFVYSAEALRERVAYLRDTMPAPLRVRYAMKANPFPPLLRLMAGLVDGIDVASGGELRLALGAGMAPARISFAGPGKDDDELALAVSNGVTINVESEGELARALACGRTLGRQPRLAIRVNPSFDLRGSGMKMGGGPKPFGIDAERVPAAIRTVVSEGAEFRGLHIYTGSQSLDGTALAAMQAGVLRLAAALGDAADTDVPELTIGGGFGIPYFHGDRPLDLRPLGTALENELAKVPPRLRGTVFSIELGRYLVGEAGVYLARIVDRKTSHGQIFLVTDGGLHHQLAASGNFGTVVRRNYPVAIASRFDTPASEVVSVVGRLCTPLDRLADSAWLPRAEVGDIVAVFCAGAYGATASPSAFLGHGPAAELLV